MHIDLGGSLQQIYIIIAIFNHALLWSYKCRYFKIHITLYFPTNLQQTLSKLLINRIGDSWIKIDQLDITCFIISLFNAQEVSDVNTSILRSLRLICWVISWVVLLWFDVCWCYGVVWLGWCGVRMQAEALVPHHTITPTHIEPEQYNLWNNSSNKLQAAEDGCTNIRNMLSIKYWNNKASDIKLVSLYSTIKMMHGPINIRIGDIWDKVNWLNMCVRYSLRYDVLIIYVCG